MADVFSKAKRSEIMRSIRSENTRPEALLMESLSKMRYKYLKHVKELPGTPDVVLPRYKAVIQVRGCFWHGHTCRRGHLPKSREEYWVSKLDSNRRRDRRNDRKLRKLGWRVFVVWECRCRNTTMAERQAKRITALLRGGVEASYVRRHQGS